MSEKEAMELIARSLEAQRRKLSFVRSTLFFGAGALALAVTTADYVVRRTTGRDLTLLLVLAGTVAGWPPSISITEVTARSRPTTGH